MRLQVDRRLGLIVGAALGRELLEPGAVELRGIGEDGEDHVVFAEFVILRRFDARQQVADAGDA